MPREPDVFGQPTRPRSRQRRLDDTGNIADLRPLDAGHRIQVDAQLVGMIEILSTHRMRMQFEAGEVRHPRKRCSIARYDFFRGPAGWELQRHDFDPIRARFGCTLLVEVLAANAIRISHEHVRPAARTSERSVRNGDVVVDEVELGVPVLGITPFADWRSTPRGHRSRSHGAQFSPRPRNHGNTGVGTAGSGIIDDPWDHDLDARWGARTPRFRALARKPHVPHPLLTTLKPVTRPVSRRKTMVPS